jgi:uncharacterized protein
MSQFTYHVPDLSSENPKQEGIIFHLSPDESEVLLIINPSELNAELSYQQLEDAFEQGNFEGYVLHENILTELSALNLTAHQPPFSRVIASRIQTDMLVQISDDHSKAWLTLIPTQGAQPLTREALLARLQKEKIVSGIKEDILQLALNQGFLQKSLIAEGTPAQQGKSAWFEYLLDASVQRGPRERNDGTVDYKDLNIVQNVETDTPLMRKHPPEMGLPGRKVTGEEIPAEMGRDYHLVESIGSKISVPDKNLLVATRSGRPVRMSRSVKVEDTLTLQEVGLETGNIHFKGSVLVLGSVRSGFQIRASGDIIVHGSVEDSLLEAGGNIEIRGSVFGREQTSLNAKGDIRASFIQNASIECFGDLHILEGLFHCECRIMGNIFVGMEGGKGQINGGNIWGANSLKTRILGSMASTATRISLGEDPYLRQKLKDIDHNLRQYKSELEQVIKSIIYIRTRASEKSDELAGLEEKRGELLETVNTLSEQISNLHESLRLSRSQCETYVIEQLHAGVKLFFAEIPFIVKEDMGPSRLRLRETSQGPEVAWSPYSGR